MLHGKKKAFKVYLFNINLKQTVLDSFSIVLPAGCLNHTFDVNGGNSPVELLFYDSGETKAIAGNADRAKVFQQAGCTEVNWEISAEPAKFRTIVFLI